MFENKTAPRNEASPGLYGGKAARSWEMKHALQAVAKPRWERQQHCPALRGPWDKHDKQDCQLGLTVVCLSIGVGEVRIRMGRKLKFEKSS